MAATGEGKVKCSSINLRTDRFHCIQSKKLPSKETAKEVGSKATEDEGWCVSKIDNILSLANSQIHSKYPKQREKQVHPRE